MYLITFSTNSCSNDKTKAYLLLENLKQLKNVNICFAPDLLFEIDIYSS